MTQWFKVDIYGSRFFKEIREHRRFFGIRCPGCGKVRAVFTSPDKMEGNIGDIRHFDIIG